ncbi:MAG: 50S ribosomal protein L32 [Candidatus Omnitrophica bacterium]|nr:50S ribosomal protein L32 [Candidatus Omnitrophota bacterium]
MAHPKRKHSKTRRDKKRAGNSTLATPSSSLCPACQQPKPAHHICPQCGEYKGIKYVEKKEKKTKKN